MASEKAVGFFEGREGLDFGFKLSVRAHVIDIVDGEWEEKTHRRRL